MRSPSETPNVSRQLHLVQSRQHRWCNALGHYHRKIVGIVVKSMAEYERSLSVERQAESDFSRPARIRREIQIRTLRTDQYAPCQLCPTSPTPPPQWRSKYPLARLNAVGSGGPAQKTESKIPSCRDQRGCLMGRRPNRG